MKEWVQFLGSVFFEKQNNSKSQTTNHTFSFKTGDRENPTSSFIQSIPMYVRSRGINRKREDKKNGHYSQDFFKAEVT